MTGRSPLADVEDLPVVAVARDVVLARLLAAVRDAVDPRVDGDGDLCGDVALLRRSELRACLMAGFGLYLAICV